MLQDDAWPSSYCFKFNPNILVHIQCLVWIVNMGLTNCHSPLVYLIYLVYILNPGKKYLPTDFRASSKLAHTQFQLWHVYWIVCGGRQYRLKPPFSWLKNEVFSFTTKQVKLQNIPTHNGATIDYYKTTWDAIWGRIMCCSNHYNNTYCSLKWLRTLCIYRKQAAQEKDISTLMFRKHSRKK